MKKVLFLIIVFSSLIVHSQVTFEKRFTIHSYSAANSILQLPNKDYVLVGSEKSLENNIQKDILLVKLDCYGEIKWWKNYGTTDKNEFGNEVKQTFDKGFIIVGSINSNVTDNTDVYLVKTDSLGNKVWEYKYDIFDYDEGYSVIQVNDSGYLIVGKSIKDNGPNSKTHLLLMRVNKNGNVVWQKVFTNSFDIGTSMVQTSDSNFVICGYSTIYYNNDDYKRKVFLFKTNLNGDSIWLKNYGNDSAKYYGTSIKELYNNDLIVSGYLIDTNKKDEVNSYFLRTNAYGDSIWSKEFRGKGYDISTGVEVTSDGNYVFLGYGEMTEMYKYDVYLLKMSQDGDTIWKHFYGSSAKEYGLSLTETSDTGFIISGIAFGYDSLWPYGRGIYIIKTDKYGNVYNTQIIEKKNLNFEIFPNPCSETLTIKSGKPVSLIEILDISGKIILSHPTNTQTIKHTFNVKNLQKGLYIVRVTNKRLVSSKLLIVE